MTALQDLEREGKNVTKDPTGPLKTGFWTGVGGALVIGVGLAVFDIAGGTVRSTMKNVAFGLVSLGRETVDDGAGQTTGPDLSGAD